MEIVLERGASLGIWRRREGGGEGVEGEEMRGWLVAWLLSALYWGRSNMSGGEKLIEFSVGSITSSQTSDGVSSLLAPMWAACANFVCDKERGRKRGSEDGKNSLVSILLVALLAHSRRRVNPQDKKFRNKGRISQAPVPTGPVGAKLSPGPGSEQRPKSETRH